jgi:type II secretory pathway component HofQ
MSGKPRPMRLLFVGALVSAVMVTWAGIGCGGSNGAAGTNGSSAATVRGESEYVQEADALCQRVAADAAELDAQARLQTILNGDQSEDTKMAEAADVLEDQLALVRSFRVDVEQLGRPDMNAGDVDRFLAKSREAEGALEGAVDALRAGDESAATAGLQRYASLSQESAAIAQESELEFEVCGGGASAG